MDKLIEAMKAETRNDDQEVAHHEADTLLVETILHLVKNKGPVVRAQVDELIRAYWSVGKWYA